MRGLERSPAFQGNPQGLRGTAHHPGRGGVREGRVMQDAPGQDGEREIEIKGDEKVK